MGNSNENLCGCKDDRQRTSFYAVPQKNRKVPISHEYQDDIQINLSQNHDLGDNCGFSMVKSKSEKNIQPEKKT